MRYPEEKSDHKLLEKPTHSVRSFFCYPAQYLVLKVVSRIIFQSGEAVAGNSRRRRRTCHFRQACPPRDSPATGIGPFAGENWTRAGGETQPEPLAEIIRCSEFHFRTKFGRTGRQLCDRLRLRPKSDRAGRKFFAGACGRRDRAGQAEAFDLHAAAGRRAGLRSQVSPEKSDRVCSSLLRKPRSAQEKIRRGERVRLPARRLGFSRSPRCSNTLKQLELGGRDDAETALNVYLASIGSAENSF